MATWSQSLGRQSGTPKLRESPAQYSPLSRPRCRCQTWLCSGGRSVGVPPRSPGSRRSRRARPAGSGCTRDRAPPAASDSGLCVTSGARPQPGGPPSGRELERLRQRRPYPPVTVSAPSGWWRRWILVRPSLPTLRRRPHCSFLLHTPHFESRMLMVRD